MSKEHYISTGDAQATYWGSPVSRKEVQAAFDDYTKAMLGVQTQQIKLDFALSFILDRLGVTPEEVSTYMTKKQAELADAIAKSEGKAEN